MCAHKCVSFVKDLRRVVLTNQLGGVIYPTCYMQLSTRRFKFQCNWGSMHMVNHIVE
jgi:hypothetical protein